MSEAGDGDNISDLELEPERRTGSRNNSAGNDADVEDNDYQDLPTVFLTPDELREKLRRPAPEECAPPNPCKLHPISNNDPKKKNDSSPSSRMPSAAERLSTRPKSAMEMLQDTIEKPKGVVPPLALPHWHAQPLDQKIPMIPTPPGLMYYTPGKVCVKLQRSQVYSTEDPYNRERVVRCSYSALNDPHTKNFVCNPQTKKILYQQGFINEDDEIIVSLGEFNKYRDYLRTVFVDDANKTFRISDELAKKEREQMKLIHQYLRSEEDGKSAERVRKVAGMKRMARMVEDFKISRTRQKQAATNARLVCWARQREQIYAQRVLHNAQRRRAQEEKFRAINENRRLTACRTMKHAVLKVMNASERKTQDQEMFKKANENYLMEWMNNKIEHSQARVQREHNISTTWRENLERRARKRQMRVEAYREDYPHRIEQKREMEAKRWELARKYFFIWLNKVRASRAAMFIDNNHESAWAKGVASTLGKTVEYLRFQTDAVDKLDEFILSIVKLKAAIKKQMELEEAEEAKKREPELEPEQKKEEETEKVSVGRRTLSHSGSSEKEKIVIASSVSFRPTSSFDLSF